MVSLEQLLSLRTLSFRLLSGRATNGAIRAQIRKFDGGGRSVRYEATVIPDEALQTEFFCFLTETLGADEHDVALITESSTGYGQAVIAAQADQSHATPLAHDRVLPARPLHKSDHCKRPASSPTDAAGTAPHRTTSQYGAAIVVAKSAQ